MSGFSDYTSDAVAAARSVLLELVRLLSEYQDDIVLIGGWVPDLLFPNSLPPHVGSMDIDLALNHQNLQEAGYKTIHEALLSKGYYQKGSQQFIYFRKVKVGNVEVEVEVDLLSGEYGGTSRSHRHQSIQDVQPRKARGSDLVFDNFSEVAIEGELPGGGKASAVVRVASIVPFLVMKGMALSRMKEKDAYDIHFCLTHHPGGLDALADEFGPHIDHGLVREGLKKIAGAFASEKHIGPKHVADFEQVTEQIERELIQRDAFERVDYLLRRLGIVP